MALPLPDHHQCPQTPPSIIKPSFLSPDSTCFYSPYDYIKRSRSLTPMGSQPTASRDPGPLRRRLREYETFDHAVALLKDARNVVILAGAGISTSIGIPDFRSKDGLYNQVNSKKRFADPQELFTKASFCEAPLAFYNDVMPIIPRLRDPSQGGNIAKAEEVVNKFVPRYSLTHAFFNLLDDKNKLRTIYTQNIDGLEKAAGVDEGKIINCHGSWDSATCMSCHGKVTADEYLPIVCGGALPVCMCAKPVERDISSHGKRAMRDRPKKADEKIEYLQASKTELKRSESAPSFKKRKRNSEDDSMDPESRPGLLKPDVTFFDEAISMAYEPRLLQDAAKIDLFLIIGTSLPVEPVNKLPFEIPATVPQVWISRELCRREGLKIDIELLGDCDLIIEELCRRAGWTNGLENRLWRSKFGSLQQKKERLKTIQNTAVITSRVDEDLAVGGHKAEVKAEVDNEVKTIGGLPRSENDMAHLKPISAMNLTKEENTLDINLKAAALNDLPLRPAGEAKQLAISSKTTNSTSPMKPKPLPDSKVKIETVIGFDWRWYVRARS